MIFRLPQKLNTKIKAGMLVEMPLDANPYADWPCHLLTADRVHYIFLCNTASLHSCLMFGKGVTDDGSFIRRALATIYRTTEADGQTFVHQRFIAPSGGKVTFAKALSRSVTGSMNDLINHAKLWLVEGEDSLHEIGFRLNEILLSALGDGGTSLYGRPNEAFRRLAEHL